MACFVLFYSNFCFFSGFCFFFLMFFCVKFIMPLLFLFHMKEVCTGFFNTLANKTRLAILYALKGGSKSVNEIVGLTGLEQSLVSHNLKLLRNCHFVEVQVNGKQRIYSLNKDTIMPLFELVDKHIKAHCADPNAPNCHISTGGLRASRK